MADALPENAKALIRSGAYAHVVTLDDDGGPYVTMAWTKVDGDELLIGTLHDQRKLRNVRRDPRVVISYEGTEKNAWGLRHYLVVTGRATVTEGGAPELLQELAQTYLGPDVVFPNPGAPPGFVTRIAVERFSGIGPWVSTSPG